ncbi:GNAT family N-acetyltransferase [Spirillospora sp. CA-128828]|uniref:GNAT family N-acetyltransferase n=1 Tax=Spirillospora sp. CA-128828 TaxID=3240033 RepID=UPI003D8C8267
MYPVSITGEGVALCEFTADDVNAVLNVYGDPVVVEHLSFEPRTREQVAATLASVIDAAKQDPRHEYSLAAVAAGEVVGFARLAVDAQHPGQSSGQLGFALCADRWGQGLGAETVRLLLRLGFGVLGLHRLWGARSPGNVTSARVMTKLGMVEEGRIRDHIRVRGAWRDSVVHSILEDEWRAVISEPGHARRDMPGCAPGAH